MHMTTVSTKQPGDQPGRDDDRQRGRRGQSHDGVADQRGDGEADDGTQQRLADDHVVDISSGRTHGAQGGELVQVLFRARIKRLGDHDGADDHAEQGAGEERGAGAGAEQPERAAAFAKLGRGQHLDIGDVSTSAAGERDRDRHPALRRIMR